MPVYHDNRDTLGLPTFVRFPEKISIEHLQLLNLSIEYTQHRLNWAQQEFGSWDDGGRAGQIIALNSAIEFLLQFEQFRESDRVGPLFVLQNALISLKEGNINKSLVPESKRGRAPSSHENMRVKARALMASEILVRCGASQSVADGRIAATLKKAKFKSGRGSGEVTARTIKGWRESVSADVNRHSTLTILVQDLIKNSLPKWLGEHKDGAPKAIITWLYNYGINRRIRDLT